MVTPDPPRCDWCGTDAGEMVRVAENVNGIPAHACRPCWDSPALALVRAVNTARRELLDGAPGARERAEVTAWAARTALARHAEAEGTPLTAVEVTGQQVRVGDGVMVGGRTLLVLRRVPVTGGVKLRFVSGELLAIHRHTPLVVMRPGPQAEEAPW